MHLNGDRRVRSGIFLLNGDSGPRKIFRSGFKNPDSAKDQSS